MRGWGRARPRPDGRQAIAGCRRARTPRRSARACTGRRTRRVRGGCSCGDSQPAQQVEDAAVVAFLAAEAPLAGAGPEVSDVAFVHDDQVRAVVPGVEADATLAEDRGTVLAVARATLLAGFLEGVEGVGHLA